MTPQNKPGSIIYTPISVWAHQTGFGLADPPLLIIREPSLWWREKSTLTFVNGRSAIRAPICSRSRCSLCAKGPSRAPKATPGALRSSPRPSVSLAQASNRSQVRIYRPCAVQMGLPRSCEKSDIDETSPLRSGLHLPSSPTSTNPRPCASE